MNTGLIVSTNATILPDRAVPFQCARATYRLTWLSIVRRGVRSPPHMTGSNRHIVGQRPPGVGRGISGGEARRGMRPNSSYHSPRGRRDLGCLEPSVTSRPTESRMARVVAHIATQRVSDVSCARTPPDTPPVREVRCGEKNDISDHLTSRTISTIFRALGSRTLPYGERAVAPPPFETPSDRLRLTRIGIRDPSRCNPFETTRHPGSLELRPGRRVAGFVIPPSPDRSMRIEVRDSSSGDSCESYRHRHSPSYPNTYGPAGFVTIKD